MAKVGIIATKKWVISLINAVLKKQKNPWDWTPGVEQDLGGGLYGKRFVGTVTSAADVMAEQLYPFDFNWKIVESGGWWVYSQSSAGGTDAYMTLHSNWQQASDLSDTYMSAVDIFDDATGNPKISFSTRSHSRRVKAPYDIWVKYVKK